MKLSADQAQAIARHIGYGNPAARLWFVGTEEGLGGAANDVENNENLLARSAWPAIIDMFAAHRTLKERGDFIDISRPRAGHVGVWQWMAKIARAFEDHRDFCDTTKANAYIRASDGLGRTGGATFLTELSPFPSKTANQPVALQQFADGSLDGALKQRQQRQLSMLADGPPKCVICYGGSNRAKFASHLGVDWAPLRSFASVSSSGHQRTTTIYHASLEDGARPVARLFMLPFLGNGAMSASVLRQFVETREFQACRLAI